MTRCAVVPGTFDPITNGHMDVIARAAKCFDRVIVAVALSTPKETLFSLEERMELTRLSLQSFSPVVEIDRLDGLLVDYVRRREAGFIVRGLRAFSDFEYEFQMALINRKLAPEVETLFLMPKEEHSYVSSSRVREIARLHADFTPFVPAPVAVALRRKLAES